MKVDLKNWHEDILKSRVAVIERTISQLEGERGAIMREMNRRNAEAARVKQALNRG